MSNITFADVVHQSITFNKEIPSQALILELVDNPWFQRLRDISQTANTRLVYMFSEHSRFGHSLGVAYLSQLLLEKLAVQERAQVEKYRLGISAAAMLHDIGHLAPGSHTAFKTWFPNKPDEHENIAMRIIQDDNELSAILRRYEPDLPALTAKILAEDESLPAWTWEIISGGGWNIDRGNWCIVDSILAGVSYGHYNIPALTESIQISQNGHLALRENRLDAMMHFAVSRHAMYRQIYQHRVLLAADMLSMSLVKRARDLGHKIPFADLAMQNVLQAKEPHDLTLDAIFQMREPWWRYHLMRWIEGPDKVLSDLASRLINRRLFKTVRIRKTDNEAEMFENAAKACSDSGYDPQYYLHKISTADMHSGDSKQSMLALMDDGRLLPVTEAEPLFNALLGETRQQRNSWLAMPHEIKLKLGRER